MRYKLVSRKDYINAVREKVENNKDALMHGVLGAQFANLRNMAGFVWTKANFCDIAKNHYAMTKGRDQVAGAVNFSSVGYVDVSSTVTVGALDVSIRVAAQSIVPYVAVDRSMKAPVDTIYFMNLVAMNAHGSVAAGETVAPNFAPISKGTFNGSLAPIEVTSTGTGALTADFQTFLNPGSIIVTVKNGAGTVLYTGKDYDRNGIIVLPGSTGSNTVNYETGEVSLNDVAAGTVTVTAAPDITSDASGESAQQVKQEFVDTTLRSKEKLMIYKQSQFNQAYMAGIASMAGKTGSAADYSRQAFDKILDLYTEDVNRDLIQTISDMADTQLDTKTLNLSTYTSPTNNFSPTKDDLLNSFIISLKSSFTKKTNLQPTVIVTGTKGGALLESAQLNWVPAPGTAASENAIIGTFKGIPVFRHIMVDQLEAAASATDSGWLFMCAKLANNESGSIAFGEYLPLIRSNTVGNWNNPTQEATAFSAMVGNKSIQNHLVIKGIITSPSFI